MSGALKRVASLIDRIFAREKNRFSGTDLQGNHYYEGPPANKGYRNRRFILRANKQETGDIDFYGPEHIAPQWNAWLRHTRQDAPTLDELQADVSRQKIIAKRVEQLEAKYGKESDGSTDRGEKHASQAYSTKAFESKR